MEVMQTTYYIQNLKCSGCAHSITQKLQSLTGVDDVFVNVEEDSVVVRHDSDIEKDLVQTALAKMGYPIVGDKNSLGAKTKSYVSCAVGKITKD